MWNIFKLFFVTTFTFFTGVYATQDLKSVADTTSQDSKADHRVHVVVAMPFQQNKPFDPHWYTPEYVDYIAKLLPADHYRVTGYFVCLQNIPQFLDDMKALHDKHENLCVLNFCDGGEWDGYPGISVTRLWEQHAINTLVPISGADTQFIYNSDNKNIMNSHIKRAGLKSLPQVLIPAEIPGDQKLHDMLVRARLSKAWPLFCKLNIGAGALSIGSSSVVHNFVELKAQLKKMHEQFPTSDILVQLYLPGPEYTVLVLKNRVYVAVRRDFHNEYNLMAEDFVMGIRPLEEEITFLPAPEYAQKLALKAIKAIPGIHHYTRVDLREDGKGNTYVLDINDRPGFGEPSTVNYMLQFHKLDAAKLLKDIVDTCTIHGDIKKKSKKAK